MCQNEIKNNNTSYHMLKIIAMYSFVCYVCFWCTFSCTTGRSPVCCLLFVRSLPFSPHFTFSLKLVRTHINYRFTTPQFFKNHVSLYAPITSDE